MFEDSLIESGNKLKTKRLATSIISFFGQFLLLGSPDPDPTDLHRSAAQNAVDDIPGSASATTPTASAAGRGASQGSQDSDRPGQRPVAHADQDS